MLKYVGKGASSRLESRRVGNDILIRLPSEAREEYLHVVASFKHLGSIVAAAANEMADARHRSQLAMNAYAPLATNTFGSKELEVETRLDFAWSLVFSRLFYNTHLWSRLQVKAMRHLNSCYMRVLQQIAD